jgi:hypothetical protein
LSENINNENSLPETLNDVQEEAVAEATVVDSNPEEAPAPVAEPEVAKAEETESSAQADENNVISSPKRTRTNTESSATSVQDNVIASSVKEKKSSKADSSSKEEKVAVHSTKNVAWTGVGKVYRGYNIVSKDAAEKWLTRSHIRLATPEEIAAEFNNK